MPNAMIHVKWLGYPGREYVFETYPIGTEFNPFSGVYIACSFGTNGIGWNALYVGEAQSLYDRLNARPENHDGLKRARQMGATHIGAMLVNGDAQRAAIETELRHVLNPPCNAERNGLLNALARYRLSSGQ